MDSESINERPIPIGLRYIAYDQWLLSHIQPSWKISQIKLFILSKCFGTNYTVPVNPSRQPSPITFASYGRAKTVPLSEDGYEQDNELNPDTEDDDVNKPFSYRPNSAAAVNNAVSSPPPTAYTLIRFSTGQVLEDSFQLSSYDISPYELLELHGEHSKSMTKPDFPPRSDSIPLSQTPPPSPSSPSTRLIKRIVCLDRANIHAYVAPYWEGWVKALRVVNRDDLDLAMRSQAAYQHSHRKTGTPSTSDANISTADKDATNISPMNWGFGGVAGIGMGSGFGFIVGDDILKLRDEDVMVSSGKKSAKLASKVKLEWKERWVVVQGDNLYICKDRGDANPQQRISLSSLVSIRDKDFLLSYPSSATSPFVPTSTPGPNPDVGGSTFDPSFPGKKGKDKLNNHSKYVICARFRSDGSGDHHRSRASTGPTKFKTKSEKKGKVKAKDGKNKSQQKKQKQKSKEGSSFGDFSYSPMAIAAATGIVLPPSSYSTGSELKVTSPNTQKREEERQSSEDDNDAVGNPIAATTHDITRPGTAIGYSTETEDIHAVPNDTHNDDDETLSHLQQPHQPLGVITCVTTVTGVSSPTPGNNLPSPLFAHTSESDWEKDIYGQTERKKQPFYHNGYQPEYRWKETTEYDRARDVWEEDVGETEAGEGKKGKGKERKKDSRRSRARSPFQYEWMILDMGGNSAFNSLLRVLHRGAPSASSTFKTNYLDRISSENDPPEMVEESSSFSSPTRRGRTPRTSSSHLDNDEYEGLNTGRPGFHYNDPQYDLRNDRRPDHRDHHGPKPPPLLITSSNLSAWNERLGVMPYPEWRIKITKKAQRAALGNISNAMLYYLFRSLEFADLPSTAKAGSDGVKKQTTKTTTTTTKRSRSPKSQRSYKLHTASTTSIATAAGTSDQQQALKSSPKPSLHSDETLSSHLDLDIGSSDENSEMEWHGWVLDISRQYQVQQQRHQLWQESGQGSALYPGRSSGGVQVVTREETPNAPSSPRQVYLELDGSYGYEAMRRRALEPSGMVSTTTTIPFTTSDGLRTSSSHHTERSRPTTMVSRSPVSDSDRDRSAAGGESSILSNLSLPPTSMTSSRSMGSPPYSSPEPPLSPSPSPLPSSGKAAGRRRLISLKSASSSKSRHNTASGSAKTDLPTHLISRRTPSMPQLSFEHPPTSSGSGVSASDKRYTATVAEHGRREVKGSSPPEEFSPPISADASGRDGGGSSSNTSKSSQFIRRRASAAGLITSSFAGSFGRSANFLIGGLWRKEKDGKEKEKDRETPLESDAGPSRGPLDEQREYSHKKDKGKGANLLLLPESSSREGGMVRSPSSLVATSPDEDEDDRPGPQPRFETKSEKWKAKKGRLVYEMEKIARGFDGD